MTPRPILAALLVAMVLAAPAAAATKTRRSGARRPAAPPAMVWHVESLDGQVLDSRNADQQINPASVVKVATSWWALEKLGPDYRFITSFYARGTIDPEKGLLKGDLIVRGAGDPDFQMENAFLVASELRRLGIRKVTGSIVADKTFWMGWENGSDGTNPNAAMRGAKMAFRLRAALDPRRWTRITRDVWAEYSDRTGVPRAQIQAVEVVGSAKYEAAPGGAITLLFEHRSKPLAETLRRFNCYSNNDIERVAASIGPASELSVLLADRLVAADTPVRIQTASGLGENRLSPRQIVAMLRGFREAASGVGLPVEHLLPVAGCDPGTVTGGFPRLSVPPYATSLVAKTGTLTSTDGGITVLAGFLNTAEGEVVFCVAVPKAGGRIRLARRTEESFVLELLGRRGGAVPRTCGPPLASPDHDATIITTGIASRASVSGAAGR